MSDVSPYFDAQIDLKSGQVPGEPLADFILDAHKRGRPALQFGSGDPDPSRNLVVPRLTLDLGAAKPFSRPGPEWPDQVLRPRLASYLAHPDYFPAQEALQSHDWTQLRDLAAATLRDVLGLAEETIAEACGFESGKRKAHDAIQRGRQLLALLGAWPWWCFRETAGRPPRTWRRFGDERAERALIVWATCRATVADLIH